MSRWVYIDIEREERESREALLLLALIYGLSVLVHSLLDKFLGKE